MTNGADDEAAPGGAEKDAAEEFRIRREELEVRRLEAAKDLRDLDKPWWRRADPLLLAVVAGATGLLGNMVTTIIANGNTVSQEKTKAQDEQALEDRKAQYSLVLQAIATNDRAAAARNIEFFIGSGLLVDKDGRIRAALATYNPVLPSASGGGAALTGEVTPEAVAQLYDLPHTLDGSGQTIALIEFGGGYDPKDLGAYFAKLKLTTPRIDVVEVDGGKNAPAGASGADGQVEGDIEVAGAVAPKARLRVYFAPFSAQHFADTIDRAVADHVSIISIGWGQAESGWTARDIAVMDRSLQRAAAGGVTVIAASGDNGVTDGVHDGRPHVDFPASSSWVVAVGGTSLTSAKSGGARIEQGWSGSGGGESAVIARPAWQSKIAFHSRAQARPMRVVPDLAASADPVSGYPLIIDGHTVQVAGTSIAAPLVAAVFAGVNQGLGHNVGYITPRLYQDLGPGGALRDIVVGDNSADGVTGYKAGPGWDAVTGWGAIDAAKTLAWLKAHGAGNP